MIAFSLGARIAFASIAKNKDLIRKAHLTGIAAERDAMSKMIFDSWKDLLDKEKNPTLKSFAWSILFKSYSQEFVESNGPDKLAVWVDQICANNNQDGLLNLVEQTSITDPIDYVPAVQASNTKIQLAVGGEDVISTKSQVERLNAALENSNDVLCYEGCGHAVANENAREWRRDVIAFLYDEN